MSTTAYDLSNSSNWSLLYSNSVSAIPTGVANKYAPIPTQVIPILIEQNVIAVSVSCANAKPTWFFAGFLNQQLQLGIFVGGSPDTYAVSKRKIWLN